MNLGQHLKVLRTSFAHVTRQGWLHDTKSELEESYTVIIAYFAFRSDGMKQVALHASRFRAKDGKTPEEWLDWLKGPDGQTALRNHIIKGTNRRYGTLFRYEKFCGAHAGSENILGLTGGKQFADVREHRHAAVGKLLAEGYETLDVYEARTGQSAITGAPLDGVVKPTHHKKRRKRNKTKS